MYCMAGAAQQRFSNCGPRTPGGPRGSARGSAGQKHEIKILTSLTNLLSSVMRALTSPAVHNYCCLSVIAARAKSWKNLLQIP
jgi:hypothetical protein